MTSYRSPAGAIGGLMAALMFLLTLAAATAQEAQETQQKKQDALVETFTLDNGLEVVVIPDRRAPVVTQMLWYEVGSADEEPGKSGIAHFFEHLMFKGTSNHPQGEFSGAIAAVGGRENAFTSYDYTAYFQQVAPEHLETMMMFEADRMRNLVLTDEVIETERQVIIEERSQQVDNEPGSVLSEEVSATLYQNHPYRNPVIGWMHEIKELDQKSLIDFYNRYYVPNNAILVVAGDVDAATVRRLADATYGKVARGPDIPPRERPTEPDQQTRRTVTLNDARVSVPSYSTRWLVPSYETAEPGQAEALDLLAEILGGGIRSRLYQELIVKQGIASSAGAYYSGTALDDTSFGVYGTPRGEATLDDVEKAINAEIEKIAADGVSEEELEQAKDRFVRAMIFARDDQSGMARMYGSTLATGGTVEDLVEWPERIRAITADEVKAAAVRYLDRERAVTSYLLPAEGERT